MTVPSYSSQPIVVVCNGTAGCSIPGIKGAGEQVANINTLANHVDTLANQEEREPSPGSKVINIITHSPVLYIQRLKRWFQEEQRTNQTKRVERSAAESERGSDHSYNSRLSRMGFARSEEAAQQFKEGTEEEKRRLRYQIEEDDNRKELHKDPFYHPKNKFHKTNNNNFFNDHGKASRNIRGTPHQQSLFKNRADNREYEDEDDGYNREVLLGGSQGDYDSTTRFPIVDVDHDYDGDYEYVKLENQKSPEYNDEEQSEENEEPDQHYDEVGQKAEDIEEEIKGEREDEEDGGGSNLQTPVVIYEGDEKGVQPSFEFVLNPADLQERYISKDPLAGAGATRGFNHDFKVMRGVPIRGSGVVQPNIRYPTVPSFNTKQIHNIIRTGMLPGTPGGFVNGTKVGIIPIEPARHARPNSLGQYLGKSPYNRPTYSRRPVTGVRASSYYSGRGVRRPMYSGPVRGHKLVLSRNPMYRQVVRRPYTSYNVKGLNHGKYRSMPIGRSPAVRIRILEDRTSEEEPLIDDHPYNRNTKKTKDFFKEGSREWENGEIDRLYQFAPTVDIEDLPEQNREVVPKTSPKTLPADDQKLIGSRKLAQDKGEFEDIALTQVDNSYNNPIEYANFKEYNSTIDIANSTIQGQNHNGNAQNEHFKIHIPQRIQNIKVNEGHGRVHNSNESQNKPPKSDIYSRHQENQSGRSPKIHNKEEEVRRYENTQVENNKQESKNESPMSYQKGSKNEHDHHRTEDERQKHDDKKYGKKFETDPQGSKKDDTYDDVEDLPKTFSKIMQQTGSVVTDKTVPEDDKLISYNHFWTLEYSYPRYK